MADEHVSQNSSKNPDPQVNQVSGDDITPSQEQQSIPDRLPQSLVEWLVLINRHCQTWRIVEAKPPGISPGGCSAERVGGLPTVGNYDQTSTRLVGRVLVWFS